MAVKYREQSMEQLRDGEAALFIETMDMEGKGNLDIHNFNHCILPRTDTNLREVVSVKPIPPITTFRSAHSYPAVAALIQSIILKEVRFFHGEQRKVLA